MENILKRKLHVQHDCNLIKFIMCTNECKCVGVYATIIRIIEQVVSWMFENGKTTHSRERQRRAAWQSPSLVVRWSCHVTECWIELKSFIYNRRRDIGRAFLTRCRWFISQDLLCDVNCAETNFTHSCQWLQFITMSDRWWAVLSVDYTMRYDTRCYINVRSKANMSQLNLPHGTDN